MQGFLGSLGGYRVETEISPFSSNRTKTTSTKWSPSSTWATVRATCFNVSAQHSISHLLATDDHTGHLSVVLNVNLRLNSSIQLIENNVSSHRHKASLICFWHNVASYICFCFNDSCTDNKYTCQNSTSFVIYHRCILHTQTHNRFTALLDFVRD